MTVTNMIITDKEQIDRIAEEMFGKTKGKSPKIDMKDYEYIKEHSETLKAIKLEVAALTEEVVDSLNEVITEAKESGVNNFLISIKNNHSNVTARGITIDMLNFYVQMLNNHLDTANILWGVDDKSGNLNNISILIILGYNKQK